MRGFDTIVMADWSARSAPSPRRPVADAIWIAVAAQGQETVTYYRTRARAEAQLTALLAEGRATGRRVLLGLDFAFGYPAGFAAALTGTGRAQAVWAWLAAHLHDGPDNANTRFAVADAINARFPGVGPFWGCPPGLSLPHLPARGRLRQGHGMTERRLAEQAVPRAHPVWKLFTTGAVGSQVLVGLPMLHRLAERFGTDLAIWPFDRPDAPLVAAEIYPALIDPMLPMAPDAIRDAAQVRLMARAMGRLQAAGMLDRAFTTPDDTRITEEGWILGASCSQELRALLSRTSPSPGPTA
ncbi:molybdopterin guanine dinucleotide synthesis [Rhodovulum adriaticum]|uniref:Molybdopterin-guanine dinucleotide biosynthesis protein B n=1 Tax=Rhodovulum adriaticum TaxID=35804 RepID=A0A4R2NLF9_RHOAD|nr:molybdopterin guanine dinucleotide synthesis [Rhodovulum adriaticum]MBK1635453.1 hypothetical protein [Rhodovulum adriaticum]TCP22024.1 hypothetical protein EV656_10870 [Rhodovulum adriaticum]